MGSVHDVWSGRGLEGHMVVDRLGLCFIWCRTMNIDEIKTRMV